MSEVIEAYEACKMTKELRELAAKDEEKRCADFESALKLNYPQYRILIKVLSLLNDEVYESARSRCSFSDHSYIGLTKAVEIVRREIESCKKEILEAERLSLSKREVIDWQERDR